MGPQGQPQGEVQELRVLDAEEEATESVSIDSSSEHRPSTPQKTPDGDILAEKDDSPTLELNLTASTFDTLDSSSEPPTPPKEGMDRNEVSGNESENDIGNDNSVEDRVAEGKVQPEEASDNVPSHVSLGSEGKSVDDEVHASDSDKDSQGGDFPSSGVSLEAEVEEEVDTTDEVTQDVHAEESEVSETMVEDTSSLSVEASQDTNGEFPPVDDRKELQAGDAEPSDDSLESETDEFYEAAQDDDDGKESEVSGSMVEASPMEASEVTEDEASAVEESQASEAVPPDGSLETETDKIDEVAQDDDGKESDASSIVVSKEPSLETTEVTEDEVSAIEESQASEAVPPEEFHDTETDVDEEVPHVDTTSHTELQADGTVPPDDSIDDAASVGSAAKSQAGSSILSDVSMESSRGEAYQVIYSTTPRNYKSAFSLGQPDTMGALSISESKRRDRFSADLRALKLEWKCHVQVLDEILQQTNSADAMIQRSYQTLNTYAESMHAICNDSFMDDNGGVIHWTRKREMVEAQRRQETKQKSHLSGETSMLKFLFHSVDELLVRLQENLPALKAGAEDVTELKTEIFQRARALSASGVSLLTDMERYELNTGKTWSAYQKSIRATKIGFAHRDRWLMEASYKTATTMTLAAFELRCRHLKLVQEQVLQLAEYSRDRLKEGLLTFLPRRRRFFLRVPEALEACVVTLQDGRINRVGVDKDITQVLADLAVANLKRAKMHQSSIMNRSFSKQPDLSAMTHDATILQGGVFSSPLVQDLKVFEIRRGRSWSNWKLALGAFTAGNYLHLFNVHDDTMAINLGNATVDEAVSRVNSKTPDLTLLLSQCECSLDGAKMHVDVEMKKEGALQSLFHSKSKVSLRLSTFAETSTWMASLNHLHEERVATEVEERARWDEEARQQQMAAVKQVFV